MISMLTYQGFRDTLALPATPLILTAVGVASSMSTTGDWGWLGIAIIFSFLCWLSLEIYLRSRSTSHRHSSHLTKFNSVGSTIGWPIGALAGYLIFDGSLSLIATIPVGVIFWGAFLVRITQDDSLLGVSYVCAMVSAAVLFIGGNKLAEGFGLLVQGAVFTLIVLAIFGIIFVAMRKIITNKQN